MGDAHVDPAESLDELGRGRPALFEYFKAGSIILAADSGQQPKIIVSGWACRMRKLGHEDKLIFDFALPGDVVGLGRRHAFQPPAYSVVALSRVAARSAGSTEAVSGALVRPGNSRVDLAVAHEERLLRDSILRLSKLSAQQRLGHLILEFDTRLGGVGLSHDGVFALPVRKTDLANHLGLSLQHLNRSLSELRRKGLFTLDAGRAAILCRRELEHDAGYSPREWSWPAAAVS